MFDCVEKTVFTAVLILLRDIEDTLNTYEQKLGRRLRHLVNGAQRVPLKFPYFDWNFITNSDVRRTMVTILLRFHELLSDFYGLVR